MCESGVTCVNVACISAVCALGLCWGVTGMVCVSACYLCILFAVCLLGYDNESERVYVYLEVCMLGGVCVLKSVYLDLGVGGGGS